MKRFNYSIILLIALAIGSVLGVFKGNEAKQKWIFKIKSRYDEKKQLAEQKKLLREGRVPLDDIEIAAFHNN